MTKETGSWPMNIRMKLINYEEGCEVTIKYYLKNLLNDDLK